MKKLLIVSAIATPLLLTGCTASDVRNVQQEIREVETDLQRENRLLQEIDEVLDDPDIADSEFAQRARDAKPIVEREIERIEAVLASLESSLGDLELTDNDSVSNGLQSFGAVLSGIAPMLGPYGAVALGVGGVAGAVGRSMGRRRGVDETLDTFENSDVPVTLTQDMKAQQEIIRKGNKSVANGVARQIARQGNG